ncbi:MAG TPA: class I SAM-dependent methyltransferase [Polyangia bacterium]
MDLKELPARAFARHPWESVRADFFLRLLRKRTAGRALSALDIGAGDGYFAERLLAGCPTVAQLTCFDVAYDGTWLQSKVASDPRLIFTAQRPEDRYDLVLMLDVLEHMEDDQAGLRDAASSFLKPGAWLLLSVPAAKGLFSHHDELLGHKRRYAPSSLRKLAGVAGLAVVDHGELFASLLVPRAMAKLGEVALGKDRSHLPSAHSHIETPLGTWNHGKIITSMVYAALSWDALCCRFASRLRLPFAGLSTWVLAQNQ